MKKIIASAIFCFLVGITSVFSQTPSHFSIQYDIGFGTGDLGEYVSAPSFRGGSVQYRYAVTDNILIGADVAWNIFYEKKDYDTYTSGTQTLSGVQYRYQNQVPILVSADYLFMPDKDFKPYIGLGIGTMYSERNTEMGIWLLEENPWQFAVKPEVGFMYNFSFGTAIKFGLKYYTGIGGDELDNQGYFCISTGLAFGF